MTLEHETRRILIVGTGSGAQEFADLVSDTPCHEVVGFVEGLDRSRCDTPLLGLPVHWLDDLAEHSGTCWCVCAIASSDRRLAVRRALAQGMRFTTVVHPLARVSTTSRLGEGTLLSVGSIVASHTGIGRHTIVNRGCLIGHHAEIGDFVTFGPGVNIAGWTRVGEGAQLGMSSVVLNGVSIGRDAVVGAGAVVTTDVPEKVQVLGVPARVTKDLG